MSGAPFMTRTVGLAGLSRFSGWGRRRRALELFATLGFLVGSLIVLPAALLSKRQLGAAPLIIGFVASLPLLILLATRFARVTLGVDRIEAWSLLGWYSVRQADLVRFRYRGTLEEPREWFLETPRDLYTLGTGPAANRLVEDMVAQWPHLPRLSDDDVRALANTGYRVETRDPAELAAILRMPHLAGEARVRVAKVLADTAPSHRAAIAEVAAQTLDRDVRAQLLAIAEAEAELAEAELPPRQRADP